MNQLTRARRVAVRLASRWPGSGRRRRGRRRTSTACCRTPSSARACVSVGARHRERKLHLAQIPLQPLRVLVDADQQERDARIVLILRVSRFQVRQLRAADPSPGREEVQQHDFPAQTRRVVRPAVHRGQRQLRQRPIDQALERGGLPRRRGGAPVPPRARRRTRRRPAVACSAGERLRRALPQRRRTARRATARSDSGRARARAHSARAPARPGETGSRSPGPATAARPLRASPRAPA